MFKLTMHLLHIPHNNKVQRELQTLLYKSFGIALQPKFSSTGHNENISETISYQRKKLLHLLVNFHSPNLLTAVFIL